jgi:hypothetical protein
VRRRRSWGLLEGGRAGRGGARSGRPHAPPPPPTPKVPRFLGVSVGLIQADMDPAARRAAYASDVTYVTNSELGFDYLRDNLAGVGGWWGGGGGVLGAVG